MFIDYYELLELSEAATPDEIKTAFRKQAIKWHPDRNPGKDTTVEMQRINEAYLILKDEEARQKFDIEYQLFKAFSQQRKPETSQPHENQSSARANSNHDNNERKTEYGGYNFADETLKDWINSARKQSVDLATQTIRDLKGMIKVGIKEGAKASGRALIGQVFLSIIILIILAASKSCHS